MIKKAKKSTCRYKVSALGLTSKGEIIGLKNNSPRFSREGGSVHAEMALMRQYGENIKTIYICRVNGKGELLPIKPCKVCKRKAKELGIKILTFINMDSTKNI